MNNHLKTPLRALRKTAWPRTTVTAPRLNTSELVEEEKTPYYDTRFYYPARLGDILAGRYQLATKLGHGSSSTVWLARDLRQWNWLRDRFVAIKIKANTPSIAHEAAHGELDILKLISQTESKHEGRTFVRHLLDTFTIQGQFGSHTCLVFEPLREPLWLFQRRFEGDVVPVELVKLILQMILHGLDFLHSECGIVHADIKPDNIMVKLEDSSILQRDAENEFRNPLPQKHYEDGRIIYLARNDYGPLERLVGIVRITDFDLAVLGKTAHKGCIQAPAYRAPEVILDFGYVHSADIWSLGVMIWDLIEGWTLFKSSKGSADSIYTERRHLALIIALLGEAPCSLLEGGSRKSLFFDAKGCFLTPELIPSSFTFEETVSSINGEEKSMFINFVRKMIRWDPKERATANELLRDPWLCNTCGHPRP